MAVSLSIMIYVVMNDFGIQQQPQKRKKKKKQQPKTKTKKKLQTDILVRWE